MGIKASSTVLSRERDARPGELAAIFLRLGLTAFGGPAAHIAMMRAEFVQKRGWISESDFLDLVGAANIIPGPSSTEVALYLGLRLGGLIGLLLAGACFILPAALFVSAFAWAYVNFGQLPEAQDILYGIKPVIIAIVAQALIQLGLTALKQRVYYLLGVIGLILCAMNIPPFAVLFGLGLVLALGKWFFSKKPRNERGSPLSLVVALVVLAAFPAVFWILGLALHNRSGLVALVVTFAKIGSEVYGSGYVLIEYLRSDLVDHLHWLTNSQLIDSVAVGQFTPGPVFTTATFIGYIVDGPLGAAAATVGIFLPAFVFVLASGKLIPRMRKSGLLSAFLDGVNVAAVAIMACAAFHLGVSSLVDVWTVLICAGALALSLKTQINSAYLVIGGAVLGVIAKAWL